MIEQPYSSSTFPARLVTRHDEMATSQAVRLTDGEKQAGEVDRTLVKCKRVQHEHEYGKHFRAVIFKQRRE